MKRKFHVWEFYPNAIYDFQIRLSDTFKDKLIERSCKNKAEFIREINNSKYAGVRAHASYSRWFNWFRYNDVYKQKLTPNRVSVTNPILPIEFTPELVSLAAHFCFDGSLPKDGKGAFYSQKNDSQTELFIKKIKFCFGEAYYTKRRDKKGVWNVRFPRFTGEICKNVCGFTTFSSFDVRIPANLFKIDNFKLAVLVSAIVDEGGVGTEYIQLLLKNKGLIEDLHRICLGFGYSCSVIQNKKNEGEVYYFYIKSVSKLFKDVCDVSKKHPLISFGFKTKDVRFILESRFFQHGKSTLIAVKKRKIRLISTLTKPKSVRELALELRINARSLRRILLNLTKQGKLKRVKRGYSYLYLTN